MSLIFTLLWLLCVHILLVCLVLPAGFLYSWLQINGELNSWLFVLLLPVALFVGIVLMLLVVRGFYLLLPPTPQGRFTMFADKGAVLWAINNAPATLVLKWFQSTLFLNDPLRYLVLKALDSKVHYTSWLTSNSHLSDLRNISIGKNTLIGECSTLCPSTQLRKGRLRVANIHIGNDVLLGYGNLVGPGVVIGNGTQVDAQVSFYGFSTVGQSCRIGSGTALHSKCHVGDQVHIGKNCIIKSRARIKSGIVIPDGSVIAGDFNGVPQKNNEATYG